MLLHAHCEGLLDLGGDILDIRWWRKANLVVEHVARKLRIQAREHQYQFNLALLDYGADQMAFNLHHKQTESLRNQLLSELLPWVPTGRQAQLIANEEMRNTYVKRFSDPRSEKGKEAIRKQLAKWGKSYVRRFAP